MMKPRKGKVRCENQVVTFAPETSVAASWLQATSHPGLSRADFIVGFKNEQVNLFALGQMATGHPCARLAQANRGRPNRSSKEGFVMKLERRVWLVVESKHQQLKSILG